MEEEAVDSMEEKEDQQSLKQKPPLTPRLIPTCCMEEDIMDTLMVHTTGENKQPQQQQKNIKEKPKYIVK